MTRHRFMICNPEALRISAQSRRHRESEPDARECFISFVFVALCWLAREMVLRQ